MLQRIQTIYYAIAVICLLLLTLGMDVFEFKGVKQDSYSITAHYNSYGVQVEGTSSENLAPEKLNQLQEYLDGDQGEMASTFSKSVLNLPLYIVSILVLLLALGAIFSFKNYKRQIRLGRMAFFFALLSLLTTTILFYIAGGKLEGLVGEDGLTKNIGFAF